MEAIEFFSQLIEFEVLTNNELLVIRGGLSEGKTTNKEKDVYDTREI